MIITKNIYNQILIACSNTKLETGGIIGGIENIVKTFVYDKGVTPGTQGNYFPNVDKLNFQIKQWNKSKIEFYGIIHSHLQHKKDLSNGDKYYIETLMLANAKCLDYLLFPIVFPGEEMISFKALIIDGKVKIIRDDIKFV